MKIPGGLKNKNMKSKEIKFALITDNSSEPSYYCSKNKYFRTSNHEDVTSTDLPYTAFFTYPEIFNGHFINVNFGLFPDIKFDLIFAAIEKNPNHLDHIKKLYPDAVVIGMYKEYWNQTPEIRNYIIDNTDAFSFPYFNINLYKSYNLNIPKIPLIIPQPLNHLKLQSTFKNKFDLKTDAIFDYNKTSSAGRNSVNNNEIFSKTPLQRIKYEGPRGLKQFLEAFSHYKYMLSTDQKEWGGIISAQSIALKTILIGSNTDYQKVLFPDLVGVDVEYLLQKIDKLHTNKKYRDDTINYAYDKLINTYSFQSIKNKVITLYNDLKK